MKERWIMNNAKEIRVAVEILLILCFFTMFFFQVDQVSKANVVDYTKGWDITYRGKTYKNQDVTKFRFPEKVKRKEKVILTNHLPDTYGDQLAFSALVYLSAIRIRVGNRVIYSYGFDQLNAGQMVGSAYHTVRLPYSSAGTKIVLTYEVGENNAFTMIPSIRLLPSLYAYTAYTDAGIIQVFIIIFLIGIGVIMMLVSACMTVIHRKAFHLFCIGALSFLMGQWSICTSKVIQYFTTNYQLMTQVEYLSLYAALIPMLCILMYNDAKSLNLIRKITTIIGIVTMVLFLSVAVILHVLNIVHLSQVLTVFHVLAVICLILVISGAHLGVKEKKSRDTIVLHRGLWFVVFCCILDVVRFNLLKYVLPDNSLLNYSLLPFGTALFIITLISGFLIHLYDEYIAQAERIALTQMAYTDVLTGLYNRAYVNRRFKELSDQKSYILISMDVNGLKRVNDAYGHAEGDRLIMNCGRILTECFGDIGNVIRMGGDEFMVLIEYASERVVKRRLDHMEKLERDYDDRNSGYQIRISYGMASGKEFPEAGPEKIYHVADQRMYDMKKETKRDVR